jgi:hypothetical protein
MKSHKLSANQGNASDQSKYGSITEQDSDSLFLRYVDCSLSIFKR